ncbi:Choline transporter-like protein 2 [Triplophysa tibetana]|uniref:Choline transporter-like protein n=1 Tax=Triplophysa tibetana TaxID=1572043 RepID=A0A5A9N9Z7_9TELE|nr:Choline transporter-like protein 2 [Triplophysa tibetana]
MDVMDEGPKYGPPKKYDPTFKGPIHNRGCTDIICCIFFLVAIVGYLAVGIVAWSHGDPRKVIYPTDSMGQFCGQGNLEKKPLLFYFNIMKCASPMVLLEFQCPTPQTVPEILKQKLCPSVLVSSKAFLQRCFPSLGKKGEVITVGDKETFDDGEGNTRNAKDLIAGVKNATIVMEGRQVAMKIFEDYTKSWYWILICLLIAVVVSLIFIVLLRFLAGIMTWVMILMVIVVIAYGIGHCSYKYITLKDTPGANVTLHQIGFQPDFTVYLHIRQTWLAFIIILAIVELIIILVLIFLRNRIRIAIELIKEASRAIGYVMSALFYPIFTFLLLTVVIAYWGITAVLTCKPENFTVSEIKRDCPRSECLFAFYGGETPYHKYLIFFQFYNVFLFFWCANFVTALGQMTLAGAFASYYWALNKSKEMPAFPLCAALGRSLRYHTGSLAFGSLILAIVQVIRVLLEYVDHKLKGAENKFAKFLMCCLKCCFWCLEKFIKFINRNAYIMVAIHGKNFCSSAHDAFFLLMRNVIRVVVLDKVTDFILFLGKLLIVGLVGILAFFFFSGHTDAFKGAAPSLHYYWVPILTVLVGSYLIAHGFFSVYAMCVDTLFLCFCEDLERNDGSAERPYYMTATLREILTKDLDDLAARTPASREETMQLTVPYKTEQ